MSEDNTYTLKREYFSQPINFKEKEILINPSIILKPNPDLMINYGPKNPKSITLSNMVEKSSHMVNTEKIPTKTITLSHLEGGWPEDVINHSEPEKVQREMKGWVRAKEKGDKFELKIRELIANTEKIIHQNQLMDVYEEYFDERKKEIISDNFEANIKMVFKDPEPYKRSVVKVAWIVPEEKEEQTRIAVAYKLSKEQTEDIPPNYLPPALVWDIEKPNAPINTIRHTSEIVTVAFNNKHSHILGVGCANGTAGVYDLDENKWIGFTKVENSHTEPVSDFVWLKSKNSNEFVTASTDGSVIWWEIKDKDCLVSLKGIQLPVDIDMQTEKALLLTNTEKITIDGEEKDITKEYGGTRIDNSTDAGAAKFLLATEQGTIFIVNKKKTEGEIGQKLGLTSGRHLGPIVGMQRNPTNFKFILTVGDWTARIWTEDLKTPILISKYFPAYLTDCLWTPRIGMFLVSRSDGWINGYDLCYKINETTFEYKVTDASLTTMSLSTKGDKLLVGDEAGIVSLIKLSKSFYVMADKEELDLKKNNLNKFFEREQTKEKVLTTQKKAPPPKENVNLEKQKAAQDAKIREIEEAYMKWVVELTGEKQDMGEAFMEEEEKQQESKLKEGEEKKEGEGEAEKKEEEKKEGEGEPEKKEEEKKEGEGEAEKKEEEKKEGEGEAEKKEEEKKEGEGEAEKKEEEKKDGNNGEEEIGGFVDEEEKDQAKPDVQ